MANFCKYNKWRISHMDAKIGFCIWIGSAIFSWLMTLFTECNCECILRSCCLCFLMSCNSCNSCNSWVGSSTAACSHSELLARLPMSQGHSPARCSAVAVGDPIVAECVLRDPRLDQCRTATVIQVGSFPLWKTYSTAYSFYFYTQRAVGSEKNTDYAVIAFCFISSECSCFSHVADSTDKSCYFSDLFYLVLLSCPWKYCISLEGFWAHLILILLNKCQKNFNVISSSSLKTCNIVLPMRHNAWHLTFPKIFFLSSLCLTGPGGLVKWLIRSQKICSCGSSKIPVFWLVKSFRGELEDLEAFWRSICLIAARVT